jgi:hypothetical protein
MASDRSLRKVLVGNASREVDGLRWRSVLFHECITAEWTHGNRRIP